jgi:hypothetical protein
MSSADGRRGYWIRYTARRPVAGPHEGRLWFARFDRDDPAATFGINAGGGDVRAAPGGLAVSVGEGSLRAGRAVGEFSGGGHDVRWELSFDEPAGRIAVLPDVVARSGLATSVLDAPPMGVRYTGVVEVDGDREVVDGFPGQQGHVVGRGHPQRWAWAWCGSFDRSPFALHVISAQDRRGPFLTPHLTFAVLQTDDGPLRFRGMTTRKPWGLGWWRIRLEGRRYRLEAEVRAPAKAMVRARYVDPNDTVRWCHNSEVASTRMRLWERRSGGWLDVADLLSEGTTNAEWAAPTPAPGDLSEHVEVA